MPNLPMDDELMKELEGIFAFADDDAIEKLSKLEQEFFESQRERFLKYHNRSYISESQLEWLRRIQRAIS